MSFSLSPKSPEMFSHTDGLTYEERTKNQNTDNTDTIQTENFGLPFLRAIPSLQIITLNSPNVWSAFLALIHELYNDPTRYKLGS